jgi:uncharacterized protein YecE (DUF72 family)
MAELFAGTSGFAYPAWKPGFYPAKLPATKFLAHYAQRLNSVEINYTFRQFPSAKTQENWISSTPPGFQFALKAPMRITHVLRLKDATEITNAFLAAVEPLRAAGKLGPILLQLPPYFRCDLAVLADFLSGLPNLPNARPRYAFEFRHLSWLSPPVYALLQQHGIALCLAESEKLEVPEVITADFVYFRLRKPAYTEDDRRQIATRVKQLLEQGSDAFVFFKHEDTPDGALYAQELLSAVKTPA